MKRPQRLRTVLGLDRRSDLPRWVAPLVVTAILLAAAELAVTVLIDDGVGSSISQLLTTTAMILMVAGFAAGAARTDGDARRSWQWFAAGGLVYLGGEFAWEVQHLVSGEVAGVSIADAFWLAAFPLYFVALHIRSREHAQPTAGGAGLIESLIVIGVFGIILWQAVVIPSLEPGETGLGAVVTVSYPAGDLALLWLLTRSVYRSNAGWNVERSLLAVGLLALVVGDTVWALPGDHALPGYADFFYLVSALTLGGAGFAAAVTVAGHPRAPSAPRPFVVELMPYVAGIAAALVPVLQIVTGDVHPTVALAAMAVLALVFIRIAIMVRQNRRMRERAEQAALTDALTGLWNHRYFQDRLHEELSRSAREEGTVGLLMIDIDHFKAVNDTIGHLGGDRLLCDLSQTLREACRPSDTPCRVGGDELAVIVPRTTPEGLSVVAERILAAAGEIRLATTDAVEGGYLTVSLSIGACLYPRDATDATSLVDNADVALYRSKREGRGRVTVYGPQLAGPVSPSDELAAAEERIRAHELDLRAVFEAAHDPMAILDEVGSIVDANPAASALTGLSIAQLRERSIFDFVSDTGGEALEQIISDEAKSGREAGEYEIVLPDGSPRTIEFGVTAFSPGRHLLVLRDITERRATHDRIAESEHKFRSLFDNAPDAIYITDDTGTILDANPAAVALTGGPRDQLIGARAHELVEPEQRPRLIEMHDAMLAGATQRGVYEGVWPDGKRRAVEFTTVPNFLPDRHLSIVRDVSDRANAQRADTAPAEGPADQPAGRSRGTRPGAPMRRGAPRPTG